MDTQRLLHFIYLESFDRSAAALLDDEAMRLVELAIMENPRSGPVITRTGGLRKLRVAAPGRGKRGGYRVLYLLIETRATVYFVVAFAKTIQADLMRGDYRVLARLVDDLQGEA